MRNRLMVPKMSASIVSAVEGSIKLIEIAVFRSESAFWYITQIKGARLEVLSANN
jgi:hypothetical protein